MKTYFKIGMVYGAYRTAEVLVNEATHKFAGLDGPDKKAGLAGMILGGALGFGLQTFLWPLDMTGRIIKSKEDEDPELKKFYEDFKKGWEA